VTNFDQLQPAWSSDDIFFTL